jgi:hypothetical protein
MRQSVARIKGHGLLEQFASATVVVRAEAAQMLDTAQQTVIAGRLSIRLFEAILISASSSRSATVATIVCVSSS